MKITADQSIRMTIGNLIVENAVLKEQVDKLTEENERLVSQMAGKEKGGER